MLYHSLGGDGVRKLKVMVGTDDGVNILFGHPGDSKKFHIYELRDDGKHELLKEVVNEAKDMEEGHGGSGKMKKVLKLIGNVDVILTRRNSPNLIKIASETEIQPVMVNTENIEDGLKRLYEHFDEVYSIVQKRKNGERFKVHKLQRG